MTASATVPESRERPEGEYRLRTVVPAATMSLLVVALIGSVAVAGLQRPFSGFFWVNGTGSVTAVFSGTPAAAAGLRRGDTIVAIGGVPTRLSVRRALDAYAAPAIGDTLVLSVLRSGEVRSVEVRMIAPPFLERLHGLGMLFIALCLALLGFTVWAHKPYDRTVVLFLMFTHSLAALVTVGWLAMLCRPWAFLWLSLCLALGSAVGLHFHLHFPAPRRFRGRRALLVALYAIALALPLLYLPGWNRDVDIQWYFLTLNAGRAYAALATLVGLGMLIRAYRSDRSEANRRRIRLVVFGTVGGVSPAAGLSVVPEILGRDRAFFVPYELTLPFLLLIPVAYVAAIQRHNLLRLERLVHRGVVHLVLLSTLALVYLGLGVGLPRLLPWTDRPWLRGLVVLLIAMLFAPLRDRLQRVADRLIYGGWYDYAAVLGEITQALSGVVDADTLSELLGKRLARTLHLRHAALLMGGKASELRPSENDGWLSSEASSPFIVSLPRAGALAQELLRILRPVSTQTLRTALGDRALTESEDSLLENPEIEMWVPLVSQRTLQGVLVTGARIGHEPFTLEDRRMLGTLAWSAAVAIENVELVSALRRRADEVNRLYSQLLKSREAERKRLARELHDRIIQDLINLHYFLDSPTAPVDGQQTLREGLRAVIDNLRTVCTELRPSALDDLDLGLAIQGYIGEIRPRYAFKVSLRLPDGETDQLETLPEEARLGLFRVLQEAVTNVHRHADARNVTVELATKEDTVTLEVRDDGKGFACPADLGRLIRGGHFGLAGAYERMNLIGGDLVLESREGGGTTLRASVPRF